MDCSWSMHSPIWGNNQRPKWLYNYKSQTHPLSRLEGDIGSHPPCDARGACTDLLRRAWGQDMTIWDCLGSCSTHARPSSASRTWAWSPCRPWSDGARGKVLPAAKKASSEPNFCSQLRPIFILTNFPWKSVLRVIASRHGSMFKVSCTGVMAKPFMCYPPHHWSTQTYLNVWCNCWSLMSTHVSGNIKMWKISFGKSIFNSQSYVKHIKNNFSSSIPIVTFCTQIQTILRLVCENLCISMVYNVSSNTYNV